MSGPPQYTGGTVLLQCCVTFLVPNVGLEVILECARLYETESFLNWNIITGSLYYQCCGEPFMKTIPPLQRRCPPTSPPEDVTSTNSS